MSREDSFYGFKLSYLAQVAQLLRQRGIDQKELERYLRNNDNKPFDKIKKDMSDLSKFDW